MPIGDDHAADELIVPAQVLCGAVYDQIGAELERTEEDRRGEGGIHAKDQVMLLGNLGHDRDIRHLQKRIRRRLHPKHFRLGPDGLFYVGRIRRVHVGKTHVVPSQDLVVVTRHPAVDIVRANHVVARLQKLHATVHGGHPAGEARGELATFDGRQLRFQGLPRRVGRSRIIEPLVFPHFFKHKRRRLVDRWDDGTCGRIRRDSGPHDLRIKLHGLLPSLIFEKTRQHPQFKTVSTRQALAVSVTCRTLPPRVILIPGAARRSLP